MNHYHDNIRPEFPAPATWSAIQQAWETLRDGTFADEGGPLKNRHEFLQIGELMSALREDLNEGYSEAYDIIPRYI